MLLNSYIIEGRLFNCFSSLQKANDAHDTLANDKSISQQSETSEYNYDKLSYIISQYLIVSAQESESKVMITKTFFCNSHSLPQEGNKKITAGYLILGSLGTQAH